MMKIIIFIFVHICFAICKNMPKSLKCIDIHCQKTISTARLNKAVSPVYGTLKNVKESSKVLIKGKNNDIENTLWLVEQEGLYGFIDLSFMKEIKNSVRNDLSNVKNPYSNEIITENSNEGESNYKSGLFSAKKIKIENNNSVENSEKENPPEENEYANLDEDMEANSMKVRDIEIQDIQTVEDTDQSAIKSDQSINFSNSEQKKNLMNLEQEENFKNEGLQHSNDNTIDTEKNSMKMKGASESEINKENADNNQFDANKTEKPLMNGDNKIIISPTSETLIKKIEKPNLKESPNETLNTNIEPKSIFKQEILSSKLIEKTTEVNDNHKNIQDSLKDQQMIQENINKSLNSDNKQSVVEKSLYNDNTKSEDQMKDDTQININGTENEMSNSSSKIIDDSQQTVINHLGKGTETTSSDTIKKEKSQQNVQNPEIKIPVNKIVEKNPEALKEERTNSQQTISKHFGKETVTTSSNNIEKEKSEQIIQNPEVQIPTNKNVETSPETLKEEMKNSPEIKEPLINKKQVTELESKQIEKDLKLKTQVNESKKPLETKEESKIKQLNKETGVSLEQMNSKSKKHIEKEEKQIVVDTAQKMTESHKTDPSDIEMESKNFKDQGPEIRKLVDIRDKNQGETPTKTSGSINKLPKETFSTQKIDNNSTDNEMNPTTNEPDNTETTDLKISGPSSEQQNVIDIPDTPISDRIKNQENIFTKEYRKSEGSANTDPWLDNTSETEIPLSIRSPVIRLVLKLDSLSQRAILYILSQIGVDSSCMLARFSRSWLHMSLESLLSVLGFLFILGLVTYSPTILRFHRDWQTEFIRQERLVSELHEKLDTVEETRQKLSIQNHQFERVIDGYKQQIIEIQQDAAGAKKTMLTELDKIKKSSELQINTLKLDLTSRNQQYKVLEIEIVQKREMIESLEHEAAAQRLEFENGLAHRDAIISQFDSEVREINQKNEELQKQVFDKSQEIEMLHVALEQSRDEMEEKSADYRRLEKSFESLKVFEGLEIEELSAKREMFLELTAYKEQLEQVKNTCQQLREDLAASNDQIRTLESEYEISERKRLEHDTERLEAVAMQEAAETKLKVLSDYFKGKEVEMARSLGYQAIESSQSQDQVDTLSHRIQMLETENDEMKKSIKLFKLEIKEAQSFAAKCKLDANEHSHELMFKINNLERSLLTERDTSKQLRAKLSHYIGPTPPRGTTANHNKDRPSSRQSSHSGGTSNNISSGPNNFVSIPPQLVPISFLPQSSPSTAVQHSPFSGRNSVASKKSNNT